MMDDAQNWPEDVITVTIEIDAALRGTSAMQKRRGLPPHVLIIESLLEMCLTSAKEIEGVEDGKSVFTDYEEFLNCMDAEARRSEVLSDWQYVRWRTSTDQNKLKFIISISPIEQSRAYGLVDAILKVLNLKDHRTVSEPFAAVDAATLHANGDV